jgi:hypothetical protein
MFSITSYHGNSAAAENNAKVLKVNGMSFYFSYETLVAVNTGTELKVIQNNWGPTTGHHLNSIDGGKKESRLTKEDFQKFVEKIKIVTEVSV